MQRPIFLSGRVAMADGSTPPTSVVIERVCHGRPVPEGNTDSKGRFSINLGQNQAMMMDASVGSDDRMGGFGQAGRGNMGNMGIGNPNQRQISERDLIGCELRAALPGYRSSSVELSGRRMLDNPDVGMIVLRPLANAPGTTISLTSMTAPKKAKKAYEKGIKEAQKNKWDKAQVQFEEAVKEYPEYAEAWFDLGRSYQAQEQVEPAREAYAKALEVDSKFVKPYLQMAQLSAAEQKWQDVADTTDRVLKLNPYDFPAAFFYNAVAHYNLQNLSAAEKSAREALKLDPNHRIPKVEHVLAIILAEQSNFPEAAKHLRSYIEVAQSDAEKNIAREQLLRVEQAMGQQQVGQQTTPSPEN